MVAYTVNFAYNDTRRGIKKVSLLAKCRYNRSLIIMYYSGMGLCSGHGNSVVIRELSLYPQSLLAKLTVSHTSIILGTGGFCSNWWQILLEKAVELAESYKPYGGQFLEFCSISLSTYQTCMKMTRKVPSSANSSAGIIRRCLYHTICSSCLSWLRSPSPPMLSYNLEPSKLEGC